MTAAIPEARERQAPAGLEDRLAEFIDREGIKGHYPAAGIAALLVKTVHASHLERWLAQDGRSGYLRDAARRIKDPADLTPAEAWAEDWRHGHLRDDLRRRGA